MPLKCAAPLSYQDAVNETVGQENMRAFSLNTPEAPGEASTQRKHIFLSSSVAEGPFCPPMHICLWIFVATGSKSLVFGDAACFMKCCHIVGAHGLAALLGCVFATNPTSSGITVSIFNLFFILLLLSLPVTHVFTLSLCNTFSPLYIFHLSSRIYATPWYILRLARN